MNKEILFKLPRLISETRYLPVANWDKNNIICRLILNGLEISGCSILHYSSSKDSLVSVGSSLNIDMLGILFTPSSEYENIIKYINVYDFLYHNLKDGNIYKDFMLNEMFSSDVTEDEFNKCVNNWQEQSFQNAHRKYKRILRCEKIPLSVNTPSVMTYIKNNMTINAYDVGVNKNINSNNIPLFELLSKYCDVKRIKIQHYIGLPLIADNRCFGVLRLFVNQTQSDKLASNKFVLHSLSVMVASLYAKTDYLEKTRKLSLEPPKNNDKSEKHRYYDKFCTALSKSVNSRACLIRMPDPEQIGIVGCTKNMEQYVNLIRNHDHIEDKFLSTIFFDTDEHFDRERTQIIAISLCLFEDSVEYYYLSEGKIIKTTDWSLLRSAPVPKVREQFAYNQKLLMQYNVQRIIIMPMPHTNSTYVTLGNTQHRRFTENDVQEIYDSVERRSLAIAREYKDTIEMELGEVTSSIVLTSALVHDIDPIIEEIYAVSSEVLNSAQMSIEDINESMRDVHKKIVEAKKIISERNPVPNYTYGDDIGYLVNKIKEKFVERLLVTKGLSLIIDKLPKIQPGISYPILNFIVHELVNNALKHSMTLHELREAVLEQLRSHNPNPSGNLNTPTRSMGCVTIRFLQNRSHFQIIVSNPSNRTPPDVKSDYGGKMHGLTLINRLVGSNKGRIYFIKEDFTLKAIVEFPKN